MFFWNSWMLFITQQAFRLAAWPRVSSASPEVPMVQAVEKVIEIPMIGKTVPGRLGFLKSF